MKIAILGFGLEGKSALKFLKNSPEYRGAEIKILDQKLSGSYLNHLEQFDLVFRSPGVPYNLPQIQKAIKEGVKFSSATKLFFDLCPAIFRHGSRPGSEARSEGAAGQVIGVTGTKGKGTTSTLIYEILKKSGRKVLLAGNIGKSPLEILPKVTKDTLVVLELSSFQLQDLEKSPSIAVIVDIFPDHLDVHKSMKEYLDAKTNIARHQGKSDVVFYFKNNPLSSMIVRHSSGKKIAVRAPDDLSKNKIMAAAVAGHLSCPGEIIEKVLKNFRGLEHRLELIHSNILKNLRIDFYNDSASTNPQTTAAAITSLSKTLNPIILIAGGKDKNLDYAPLAAAINKSNNVKQVILIGENKNKIKQVLSHAKVPVVNAGNLESAVKLALHKTHQLINSSTHKLATVLFSPAAASFDMFKDYKDRGKQFKQLVKKLK